MKALASALLLLSLSAPALAAEVCPAPHAFRKRIYNCGQNKVAVEIGHACAKVLIARSQSRGASLQKLLDSLRGQLGSAQKRSMADTASRLRVAIASLEKQILELQHYTDRVASYSDQMIDFAGSESEATSPACFNDNFKALQGVVDRLDREIISSKKAREAALAMVATVSGREQKLDADATSAGTPDFRAIGGKESAPLPSYTGEDRRGHSDISGTEEPAAP